MSMLHTREPVVEPSDIEALEALIEEARQRARRRRRRYAGVALLIAAGIGSAGIVLGGSGGPAASSLAGNPRGSSSGVPATTREPRVRNGPLTMIDGNGIVAVNNQGHRHRLFRCQPVPGGSRFCSTMESIAWSPKGDKLLFSSTTITIPSRFNGLHVLDLANGKTRRAGIEGFSPDWSRDGRIALVEPQNFPTPVGWISIRRINRPVATEKWLSTGTGGYDSSPSWSPDGKQLVFATRQNGESTISIIDSDGLHRRLLARHASWPAWSPDGGLIAYRTPCGVKLITPGGTAVPPRTPNDCGSIGVHGVPYWSPDGRRIAIANRQSVYVMDKDGTRRSFIRLTNFGAWYRPLAGPAAQISWQPIARP